MTCTVCGTNVQPERHDFFEGCPRNPVRRWTIIAPRYFASSADFMRAVAYFCGSPCSVAWHKSASHG